MENYSREDDFLERREHLTQMSDQELKDYFWYLADEIVKPMIDLAQKHTSPSIERSVLLRMGFSGLEAKAIVNNCLEKNLLAKGAGHCVYRLARLLNCDYRTAGLTLAQGENFDKLLAYWNREVK